MRTLAEDFHFAENGEVGIQIGFNLSTLLNDTIDGQTIFSKKLLSIDSKPIFDRTKQELLKLIAKIDNFKYYED